MALRLVTGPANAGKAGELLRAYRDRLDEGAILVVPRAEDVEHTRRELAERGAVLGVRVVRFGGLFELIADRLDPLLAATPRASALVRELLVGEAVRRLSPRSFGAAIGRPGFVRAATRFLAELATALVDPPRLERALSAWAAIAPRARSAYARDLAALYATYHELLFAAGLLDDEIFARRALDSLRGRPHVFERVPVFAYGFDDFTPLELDAIETLARRAGAEVTVSLPFERGRTAFRATSSAFAVLSELAEGHTELSPTEEHYAPGSRGVLGRLERRLFEPGPAESTEASGAQPTAIGDALRLHLAGGERAEVELAGAEVLHALDDHIAPGDVAVVARDPASYAGLLDEVFGDYGIPFSIEREVPLAHTALGRGLIALLRCAAATGSARDLIAYLRTPGRLREPRLVEELEAELRRSGVEGLEPARELWEERRWRVEEIDRLRAAAGTAQMLDELDRRLESLFVGERRREAPVHGLREREDAAALRAARGALADVARLCASRSVTPPDAATLAELLADVPVRLGDPPSPDRVRVAGPEAIRARRFSVVVVLGLGEGEFPRRPRPDPFLSDEQRREVAAAAGLALPVREDELDRERLLFYACASRAEQRLVLSARVTDEEGAPESPSFFLEDVRELFGSDALEAVTVRRTLADVTWPLGRAPTEREHERSVAAAAPAVSPPEPGPLSGAPALAELAARRDFSAGELETFAGCGVRWLVEKVVRPRALEPDPEPLARGRLAHELLRSTLARLRERTGSARLTDDSLPRAEETLRAAMDELEADGDPGASGGRLSAIRARLERDLVRYLRREAAAGGEYEPSHLELSFGLDDGVRGDTPEPVREESLAAGEEEPVGLPALELAPGGPRLRGRIDRVDTRRGHAVVRDYKGGSRVSGVAAWEGDDDLQVALYMLAVRELLGLDVAGGLYVPLAKGRARGVVTAAEADSVGAVSTSDVRDAEAIDDLLAVARRRALELAEQITAGEVRPCPERCGPGGGCRYPSICRAEASP